MTRISVIERIRDVMRNVNPHCKTILYGSEARGDAHIGSDIDLLILVDGDSLSITEEKKIAEPLYAIEVETGISISPMIMLRKVWDNRPFKTPFYLNVEREGILL